MKGKILAAIVILLLCTCPSFLRAEDGLPHERVKSMGLTSRYEYSWGGMLGVREPGNGSKFGGQLYANLTQFIGSPLIGIGLGAEAYAEAGEKEHVDGGFRILGVIKPIFLQAGADYSIEREETDLILSLNFPMQRGGLFGSGHEFRIDWLPGRAHSVFAGLRLYLDQPYRGKSRPEKALVDLPLAGSEREHSPDDEFSPELIETLEHLAHASAWISRYTNPFFDIKKIHTEKARQRLRRKTQTFKEHFHEQDELYPAGHTFETEIEVYHAMLGKAFRLALGAKSTDGIDRKIAEQARKIIFEDVLLPYDRLLGRMKKHDSLLGFGEYAERRFSEYLYGVAIPLSEVQRSGASAVFRQIILILEENRAALRTVWNDSEFVWLPLQYGLQPHQYDTREELDALLGQVIEKRFSHANRVFYVINEQFQAELARTILSARDYHALWIHDYRGVNAADEPDSISFRQSLVYLEALTRAVQQYDDSGKIPAYLIVIDQYFYEGTGGRFWLEFLQNPLEHRLKFPPAYSQWTEELDKALNHLKTAIADSDRLQAEAHRYGQDWIRERIKVHVNVTNRADSSFRSSHIIDYLPFVPDDLMRDHRKIVFYDVTEEDPGKGEALYSGMGVGEQYVGATWEDRALLVQGPAILSLKNELRRVLLQQGFKAHEIPAPLRQKDTPANYEAMVQELQQQGWRTSVMDAHNQTGFGVKEINVLKATLYSLIPSGSSIIIPDGFWNAPVWGGMLAGAALRGCQVLAIVPSPQNSTFTGAFPLLSMANELFTQLFLIQDELREELEMVGGMLKLGIYNRDSLLGTLQLYEELSAGVKSYPFLTRIFPFTTDIYEEFAEVPEEIKELEFEPVYYADDAEDRKTKLHLKMNFFLSREARRMLSVPGWRELFKQYLLYRMKFLQEKENYVDIKDIPPALQEAFKQVMSSYWADLSDEEKQRAMAYMTIGSQNHDYRGLMLDGEVVCAVSGVDTFAAAIDFFFLSGITTWVEDLETLEELLPSYSGWRRWFSRYIMKTL
ncbi:MAG: hypothetical protein GY801_05290 [bacterium]|nr:hypothetical protein [bacterium]